MRITRLAKASIAVVLVSALVITTGCQLFVDAADHEVYRLIDKRQEQAVGVRHDANIGPERIPIKPGETAYKFVPHPVDDELPPSFEAAGTRPAVDNLQTKQQPGQAPASQPSDDLVSASLPSGAPETANGNARPEPLPLPPIRNTLLTTTATATQPATSAPAENGVGAVATAPAPAPALLADESGASSPAPRPSPLAPSPAPLAPRPAPALLTDESGASPLAPRPSPLAPRPAPALLTDESGASGAVLTLSEALAYSFRRAREFQEAKEDLYLAALALTLERHLWTPQLVGNIKSQYANYGEVQDWDHAMDMVTNVGVEQRLPYGGKLTAQVINSLMRDLTNHVTTGETGQALLRADIPLLKGAGPVAYETRYQAERQLIYAVRAFERFRRGLTVDIATDYFNLQQLREAIFNSGETIEGFHQLARRARAMWKAGKVTILDVQRAEQDELNASNDRLDAVETYQTALDAFKLRIGMPTEQRITIELTLPVAASQPTTASQPATTRRPTVAGQPAVANQQAVAGAPVDNDPGSQALIDVLAMPPVDEAEAVRVALAHRLDLLNQLDQIGDAERGVVIAENSLLPQLDAWASVQYYTDPDKLGAFKYNSDRATYRAGLNLELPLDRKAEQTRLRETLVLKRRAERAYAQARDTVVQQVRRAMRRVELQRTLLQTQNANRQLAQQRLRAAQYKFQHALVASLEVVDAQNALLRAQNGLAQAQAAYKVAILQFWRDTDTLRVAEDGKWNFALAAGSDSR